jgi:uncharacterized protein (TIGR02001 family)
MKMKKLITLSLAAMMLSALFCTSAIAKGEAHKISGWVAFSNDYYYRGISQTENDKAIQAEIDYEHESGFYAGIWGGNISGDSEYVDDFDAWTYGTDEGNVEIDVWAGYWTMVGPLELDLMAMYLYFPGNADAGLKADPNFDDWIKNEAEADYWEFHIGLAYSFDLPIYTYLSVGYDFSPDYWGEDGTGHHVNAVLELGLPFELTMQLEAGYVNVEGDKQTGRDSTGFGYGPGYNETAWTSGDEGFDYNYYRVGLSRDIFGLNVDVSYHLGMSEDGWIEEYYGYAAADDQLILTVSYSF